MGVGGEERGEGIGVGEEVRECGERGDEEASWATTVVASNTFLMSKNPRATTARIETATTKYHIVLERARWFGPCSCILVRHLSRVYHYPNEERTEATLPFMPVQYTVPLDNCQKIPSL